MKVNTAFSLGTKKCGRVVLSYPCHILGACQDVYTDRPLIDAHHIICIRYLRLVRV